MKTQTIKQTINELNKKGYVIQNERVGNVNFYKVSYYNINGLLFMARDLKKLNDGTYKEE